MGIDDQPASAFRPRYDSVDALRGLAVAAMLVACFPGNPARVFAPLVRSEYGAGTLADLVFPLFLFVMGVSIALVRERLDERASMARAIRLVGLGLVLNALAYLILDQPMYRIPGVLQRVGLCYGIAALLVLHAQRGAQWIAIVAILLGYWAWMGWGEPYTLDNRPDPEGLSSTLPAVASTLLGVRAGAWLRVNALRRIAAAGLACLLLAEAWSPAFPMDRALWTSSYVLWSAGWSMLALAGLDYAIDLLRWPAVGRRLGRNAIAIFAGATVLAILLEAARWREPFAAFATRALGSAEGGSLAYALAFLALAAAGAFVLERRETFLRI